MLAEKRSLYWNGKEISRTPLLLPSFSSKVIHKTTDFQKLLAVMEEVITGPILVSAYDIHYGYVDSPITFPELIFIDSGGYESSKDSEFSDLGYTVHEPKEWTEELHQSIVDNWHSEIPTIIINFDHPKKRIPIKEQIAHANNLVSRKDGVIHEILIKPETPQQRLIKIDSVLENIRLFSKFDILGFTEKELGNSMLNRMKNIAIIRRALQKEKINIPIHIFGSLDPVTTPLYFIAGADIFDGLTWLRFSFINGFTAYKYNGGALKFELKASDGLVEGRILYDNIYELEKLSSEMQRYLLTKKFESFKYHKDFFERSYELLMEELKEV